MLWTWLLEVGSKGAVLSAAMLILALLLRRTSAAARHFVLFLGVCSLVAMPVLTPLAGYLATVYAPTAATFTVPAAFTSLTVTDGPVVDWRRAAAGVWAVIALLLIVRTAGAHILVARMAARARPCGTVPGAVVRISSEVGMPFTCGLFRPVILLPESAADWPEERRNVVLLHEAAHVMRRDALARFVAQIGCALHWFNPLAWVAAARMVIEQEHACDDWVIERGVRPSHYAEHLLEIAHYLHGRSMWRPAALAMANCSDLQTRLHSILRGGLRRSPLTRAEAVIAIAAVAALVTPLAAIRAQAGGAVSGILSDGNGVVANALVTLRGANQATYRTRTDAAGNYGFAQLTPGTYELRIAAPGFAESVMPAVTVDANRAVHLRSLLQVGEIREGLDIVAERPGGLAPVSVAQKRLRIGGNVQAARLIHQVRPEYPAAAKQAGIDGTVLLRAVIGTQGDVSHISVLDSPNPALAGAATKAVRQWRYTPTWLNGQPVEVETTIAINYKLSR
ncbi:MAG: TonB family protein [Bryobacterales bacterium]|nr:TonB family protein [Bryobacterales bacterium]